MSNDVALLSGIDQRSSQARQFRDITSALIIDQGDGAQLSEAKLQLIRRFAALCVVAEEREAKLANGENIDISEHSQLALTLVRIATRIGVARLPKNVPTLSDYLAKRREVSNA